MDIAEDGRGPYASSPADIRATAEMIAATYSFNEATLAGAICSALVMERGAGWQDISSAPKDGTPILVFMDFDGGVQMVVSWTIPAKPTTHDHAYPWAPIASSEAFRIDAPTHWQPLPSPPKDKP